MIQTLHFHVTGRKRITLFLLLFISYYLPAQSPYQDEVIKIHKGSVNMVQFHPNGKQLLSASSDKTCKIYDLTLGKVQLTLPLEREVHAASFTHNGDFIVLGSGPELKVYTAAGEYYRTYKGHSTAIWSLDTGPENRLVVTGSFDKAFYLWDIIAGEKLQTLTGHTKSVLAVALSPDGKTIASGSLDMTVRLWDIGQGKAKKTSENHKGNVVDLAFSPDGKILASASRDKQVILWNVASGEKLHSFTHPSEVFSVAFSPDGVYLVSGTLQGNIYLWDMTDDKRIAKLTGHTAAVLSIAFRPDGKKFASGSYDQTIRLWTPEPELFVQYAFPDSLKAIDLKGARQETKKPDESRKEYTLRLQQWQEQRDQHINKLYQRYLQDRQRTDTLQKM